MGRLPSIPDPNEVPALKALIAKYDGNLTAMARALGNCDRQKLTRKLEAHGLGIAAGDARRKAAVKGPRSAGTTKEQAKERQDLLRLIALHGYREVAVLLGISPRTMLRKMSALGIHRQEIDQARQRSAG